ncbi:cuticle protein 7-like [Nilaparvata lugens]|uniref:Cuticular protein n=1 Tax=Nilaparvata lugens TaxID=108931 RepID=A0A2S1ZSB3_NILLU|nr:cuticle protein 7-like [Nilaparvata lugens]AWK28352.1 cuticular protein [Nilaparvata lugens]
MISLQSTVAVYALGVTLLAQLCTGYPSPAPYPQHHHPLAHASAPLHALPVAAAAAAPAHGYENHGGHHGHVDVDYHAPAHYKFEYEVHDPHTHDVKSQHEARKGDDLHGFYKLVEPDGTIREVHYKADKHNGFNAVVKKHGHSIHPIHYKKHH